ncbi:hypothetical protein, partial [Ralstonia pseudosolanacearum]|uniref:hypothetical protein n=1 Tax=Ralstonia pseudosolanacearum TaxID=1310165 RepID=UPI002002D812
VAGGHSATIYPDGRIRGDRKFSLLVNALGSVWRKFYESRSTLSKSLAASARSSRPSGLRIVAEFAEMAAAATSNTVLHAAPSVVLSRSTKYLT